jgi:hypothetical protein
VLGSASPSMTMRKTPPLPPLPQSWSTPSAGKTPCTPLGKQRVGAIVGGRPTGRDHGSVHRRQPLPRPPPDSASVGASPVAAAALTGSVPQPAAA